MTRTKLDTPAFADQSVDSRNIADGTIQAQDISGSITGTQLAGSIANDKLANSSFTLSVTSVSLGASSSIGVLVSWQAVTVADGSTTLTAEAGKGYFLDTNTGVIEVFLPSSPNRGDVIILVDYSGTFATNQAIINTGGQLIDSTAGPDFKLTTNNTIAQLVYVDANKGWLVYLNQAAGSTPDNALATGGGYDTQTFIEATGGTVTTSGNFKIHSFTGDGNFVVSSLSNSSPNNAVDYVVVAGGGGAGSGIGPTSSDAGGGGGAGGYREGKSGCYTASPLAAPAGITVTATTFPISVGGGGTGGPTNNTGGAGSNSVFSTITSAGGGLGSINNGPTGGNRKGGDGGSGGGPGGGGTSPAGGSGNTPPVSPPQGQNGSAHTNSPDTYGGAGGGAGGAGQDSPDGNPASQGGAATPSSITGSAVTYAGGGGGGGGPAGPGGHGGGQPSGPARGGGGPGGNSGVGGNPGTANTGGGGGGGGGSGGAPGGSGGKGIVILRYKFQ